MNFRLTKKSIISGFFIYSIGDTIASLIIHQFEFSRLFGMCFIGATIYSFEIPAYFSCIDTFTKEKLQLKSKVTKSLFRTVLALLYFNPIWIARHLLFINLFSFNWEAISWSLITISSKSFLVNIPLSIIANYLIQNMIPLKYRFISSAVFSSLMAIYYALSAVIF